MYTCIALSAEKKIFKKSLLKRFIGQIIEYDLNERYVYERIME